LKFKRKITPDFKPKQNFITKKRFREDEIDFNKLRSYRLNRVKKELEKNDLEACILFDPVNVRYALDTVNMSVYNMHNLTRYCFIPINGPTILYEYFNCEILSKHLNLIDEIRPAIRYPTDGGERGGTFQKNMTITVESYIGKVGGKEGVKLEQQYLISEKGLELMSNHPLEDIL